MLLLLLTAAGSSGFVSHEAWAADELPGPYLAAVERVVDGDTIAVKVAVWLQQDLDVLVRVRGIDAPELSGDCDLEEIRAGEATEELKRLVGTEPIRLTAIEGDKYYGRVLADVTTAAGENVGLTMIAGGFARAYDGAARQSWCAVGSVD